ncbi:MAG: O-antigen ligase family protein [Lachnospiraceae bacterium]|nr:O-antigen ligase family protein [Lachnospiraceae bacterium]
MAKKKRYSVKRSENRYVYTIPAAVAVGIIPLITKVFVYSNKVLAGFPWFMQGGIEAADVALAYKSFFLQILMFIMIIMLALHHFTGDSKLTVKRRFIFPALYVVLVLLSGVLSAYPSLAFGGSYERFEPVGAVISYIVIFYYSYTFVNDDKKLGFIIKALAVPVFLMVFIGVLQGIGSDPFSYDFFKRLIVPAAWRNDLEHISIRRQKGIAYLTLYNENYVGMYMALIIPALTALAIAAENIAARIASVILCCASVYVLICSGSQSGMIAIAAVTLIMALIRFWGVSDKRIRMAGIAGAAALTVVCTFLLRQPLGRIFEKDEINPWSVAGVRTEDDEVVFDLECGNELHSSFDIDENGNMDISFRDKDGRDLIFEDRGGQYVLEERFEYSGAMAAAVRVDAIDRYAAVFVIDDYKWPIIKADDGTYYYLNTALNPVKFPQVKRVSIFPERFLSGRGKIWNRSLPLLKEHIFLGSGANTFITQYPQDDYVDRTYTYGWGSFEYDVKAHCFYLNDAIENGVAADACLAVLFIVYIIMGIRKYGKKYPKGKAPVTEMGLFAGCTAYMITALANDSNVCVAPVFWAVFGISNVLMDNTEL